MPFSPNTNNKNRHTNNSKQSKPQSSRNCRTKNLESGNVLRKKSQNTVSETHSHDNQYGTRRYDTCTNDIAEIEEEDSSSKSGSSSNEEDIDPAITVEEVETVEEKGPSLKRNLTMPLQQYQIVPRMNSFRVPSSTLSSR